MSNNIEKLRKTVAFRDIATQMLTQKDREILIRFNEELDMLREEREIPDSCDEPEEITNEAFQLVPGAERVLDKHNRILENLVKAGSG